MAIASPFVSGVAASTLVAASMVAAGLTVITYCFKADSFGSGFLQFFLGGITAAAGALMLATPVMSLFTLTGLLLAYFIVDGGFSIYSGFKLRPEKRWGWLVFSGVSSLALAGLLWYQWPASGTYAVGLLIGVRLLIAGWAIAMLSISGDSVVNAIDGMTEEERLTLMAELEAQMSSAANPTTKPA